MGGHDDERRSRSRSPRRDRDSKGSKGGDGKLEGVAGEG